MQKNTIYSIHLTNNKLSETTLLDIYSIQYKRKAISMTTSLVSLSRRGWMHSLRKELFTVILNDLTVFGI